MAGLPVNSYSTAMYSQSYQPKVCDKPVQTQPTYQPAQPAQSIDLGGADMMMQVVGMLLTMLMSVMGQGKNAVATQAASVPPNTLALDTAKLAGGALPPGPTTNNDAPAATLNDRAFFSMQGAHTGDPELHLP